MGDVGVVGDPQARQDAVPRLACDLPERHRPVEGACLVMAGDVDALGADGKQIALRPAHAGRIDRDRGADLRSRAAVRGELPARAGLGERVAHLSADTQQRRPIPSGYVDQPAGPEPVSALLPPEALRRRQEDRVPAAHRPHSCRSSSESG